MITCYLMGGLGNQLFQICTTISYAIHTNTNPVFVYSDKTSGITERATYWNTFLKNIRHMVVEALPYIKLQYIKEKGFHYTPLPLPVQLNLHNANICLFGYFQSYKYFDKDKYTLFRLIQIEKQKQILRNIYKYDTDNIISMHFRLGDYKMIQDKHILLPVSYYKNSLETILSKIQEPEIEKIKVLYFCEAHDEIEVNSMIASLKETFNDILFEPINPKISDWQQVIIMSSCKYNIIANSTFSWWGAYFNIQYKKIVCYPSQWFGPALTNNNTSDLFPPDWTCINI